MVASPSGRSGLARGGPPVEVDHVVLAAGAVGSAALMVRSAERHAALAASPSHASFGRGLGFNYGNAVIARFRDQPTRPGDTGVQINFIASKASDERFVLENAFLPPALMSTLVPASGAEHRRWMERYRHLGMAANTIGSPQSGSVDGRQRVSYRVRESEMDVIHESLALLIRTYLHAGAEEVGIAGVHGNRGAHLFRPGDEQNTARLLDRVRRLAPGPEELMLASAHPQGGLRIDRSPDAGAVDRDFRVHGVNNLFVADASLFPSTIVVNPQWTVMALAQLAAQSAMRIIAGGRVARTDVERAAPEHAWA